MASEQRLGYFEKGTAVGIHSEAIKERKPITDWLLYEENFRRMQKHVKEQDEGNAKKETKRRMEGIKAIKPTVLITYPKTIHFSTTCMIKDTYLTGWDEIWYKKFLFTYGMGEILIEANGKSHIIHGVYYAPEVTLNILSLELLEKQCFQVNYDGNRCNLSLMFTDKEIKRFDEDRLRRMQNQYLQEYFESITKEGEGLEQDTVRIKGNLYSAKVQSFNDFVAFLNLVKIDDVEFDMVEEIMGLSKGIGEEIKRCYMNYLEILISHFKTARAPRQGHNDALLEPAWRAEKDRECLGSHQWEIGDNGAQKRRPAVLKGKKFMEHFDVQLEDTTKSPEEPTQVHYKGYQKLQRLYTDPSSSRIKEEYGSSTSRTSDDFTVIT
nr:ARID DNA-binding domain-containing protein [Tanacetum cinerariifolium]